MASDDPWLQNMLRPIVEAAGYRVVDAASDIEADLTIAFAGQGAPDGGHTIWLRAEPESSGPSDTIYRYDRDGLLAALKQAAGGKA